MKKSERIFNIVLGISIIHWGVAGIILNHSDIGNDFARIFTAFLNITVGSLIIFRTPIIGKGSGYSTLISLPSLICGGILFKLSMPFNSWETYTEIIFTIGGSITLTSFLFLGRNFSILPGMRQIVKNGPFRIIRHPSYFGEIIITLAYLIAGYNLLSLIVFLIFIPLLIYRINEEEKLLSQNRNYLNYMKNVKWKLLPFIW